MADPKELKAGWGKSPVSRKWHYFQKNDDMALCKKIGFFFGEREEGNNSSPDNCAECRKKLAKIELQVE